VPSIEDGMARYDINDPEDLQVLIRTGVVWKSGPKTMQTVLRALQDGTVERVPEKEPANVKSYLDRIGVVPPAPRNEDAMGPPAEPTDFDEEEPGGPPTP
jgi:hypothetical protein